MKSLRVLCRTVALITTMFVLLGLYSFPVSAEISFSDDFESYPIGSNPSNVYNYYCYDDWGTPPQCPILPDLYRVGLIGQNKVLQFHRDGPSYHFPTIMKLYNKKFISLSKIAATFYYTQKSIGLSSLIFEYKDQRHYVQVGFGCDNTLYLRDLNTWQALGRISLWDDKNIIYMDNRIEVERIGDKIIASIIRLDTGARKSFEVISPEYAGGGYAGFVTMEDWGGGVYLNVDDFFVKGETEIPIAIAGTDQTVQPGTIVTLDGSNSSSPDGYPLTYAWTIKQKPITSQTTISNPAQKITTLLIDKPGDYIVELVVTDSLGTASVPSQIKINTISVAVSFFDDFESYAIDSNPSNVYNYNCKNSWGNSPVIPDLFKVGYIGSNKVLQFHWNGPSYHFPDVMKLYNQEFLSLSKIAATFYATQQNMGLFKVIFEYKDDEHFVHVGCNWDNTLYVYDLYTSIYTSIPLWSDQKIWDMNNRIEVERIGDNLIASIIRLDTGDKKSFEVVSPQHEGGYAGFGTYNDCSGGIYLNVDDFCVNGEIGIPIANAGENLFIFSEQQPNTILSGTATDIDGDPLSYRWKVGTHVLQDWKPVLYDGTTPLNLGELTQPFAIGEHTLILEVTDSKNSVEDTMVLTINNSPPVVNPSGAGIYQVGTDIVIGGQISDYDGNDVQYEWYEGSFSFEGSAGNIRTNIGGTPMPIPDYRIQGGLPLGKHIITLKANDGVKEVTGNMEINITDTQAPTLHPVASPSILWPPNHEMVNVAIVTNAQDNSGLVNLSALVTSSEPPNVDGSGNTIPDFTEPVIDQNTGIITLQLRAERSGKGNGRKYSILITAKDETGNNSTATIEIIAPHDKGKKN